MNLKKLIAGTSALLLTFGAVGCSSSESSSSLSIKESSVKMESKTELSETETATTEEPTEQAEQETEPATTTAQETTEPETEPPTEQPETYESNSYFDVIERGSFDKYGTTYIIDKVTSKKTGSVSATVIAKGPDGAVIGKSEDTIYLTEGNNNYFSYSFSSDVSNATFDITLKNNDDSWLDSHGDANAVEMTSWNAVDNYIYISVSQVKDNIDYFSQFKILYYQAGQIVDTDYGFISDSAENLTGVGSTDVIEESAYGIEYDNIEFIYEP